MRSVVGFGRGYLVGAALMMAACSSGGLGRLTEASTFQPGIWTALATSMSEVLTLDKNGTPSVDMSACGTGNGPIRRS
jgi:hypothetical protein